MPALAPKSALAYRPVHPDVATEEPPRIARRLSPASPMASREPGDAADALHRDLWIAVARMDTDDLGRPTLWTATHLPDGRICWA